MKEKKKSQKFESVSGQTGSGGADSELILFGRNVSTGFYCWSTLRP